MFAKFSLICVIIFSVFAGNNCQTCEPSPQISIAEVKPEASTRIKCTVSGATCVNDIIAMKYQKIQETNGIWEDVYLLYKNGTEEFRTLDNGYTLDGRTDPQTDGVGDYNLKIISTRDDDSGQWRCVYLSPDKETESSSVWLVVADCTPDPIIPIPRVNIGNSTTIRCHISGPCVNDIITMTYQKKLDSNGIWEDALVLYKNGNEEFRTLDNGYTLENRTESDVAVGDYDLTIVTTEHEDSGQWRCVYSSLNEVYNSASVTLDVLSMESSALSNNTQDNTTHKMGSSTGAANVTLASSSIGWIIFVAVYALVIMMIPQSRWNCV